ncbi:DUF6174 domain-containing protein [Streptomyces sp. NPDC006184]|uniref:DUF6174 domain-containing protein n=1 Tax=Streptomyces sp. NPDC006184 TaxID=3155455 RepID=UPI0033BCCD57
MSAGRFPARPLSAAALTGAALCLVTACGGTAESVRSHAAGGPRHTAAGGTTAWREPAAYGYTLTSTTEALAGRFRVQVHDGKVTEVAGLDEDSRRQVREHAEAPTLGGLLRRLEQARKEHAETAQARYAADGHPVRIALDWSRNAVDDEALYLVSAYTPAPTG